MDKLKELMVILTNLVKFIILMQNFGVLACDSAGPGFNNNKEMPKAAAKNVQCINTSVNYETIVRKCHQNWLMGKCGIIQPAIGTYTEHGLLAIK